MKITEDIRYIGVNDHQVDLFEGQYPVPHGVSYNSYLIMDERIAVMDTVDAHFTHEWLDQLQAALAGRQPDYLVVQHMEPDHAANVLQFHQVYPQAVIVASSKAFMMMQQFFGEDFAAQRLEVGEGDTLCLGRHTLHFVCAPMVHWPEVIVTYDSYDKVLFSADGFGKFGALDIDEPWADEARRYYIGIVAKYGAQVQALLRKAAALDIQIICPLHGPVLQDNLGYYLGLYQTWSSYNVESEGIVVAYTSVYGHTQKAVQLFVEKLRSKGCPQVEVYDLARCDLSQALAAAFRYPKLVLATTTYNAEIFPFMRDFIQRLVEHNFQNRCVALIENGSWAPMAAKVMRQMLAGCKEIRLAEPVVSIRSALAAQSSAQLESLAEELCGDYLAQLGDGVDKHNPQALFRLGYGLYVVTCHDGHKDNGLIVNSVNQVSDTPNRVAVTINKQNYSHHVIKQSGRMNLNCLTQDAPFKVFEAFGFRSGRNVDKFADCQPLRSDNGLIFLPRYINAFLSLRVEQYVDLGSHGMFICSVEESRVISDAPSMTYAYYHSHVKPQPAAAGKGFVCRICGYVYQGEQLPDDFVCPLCKHGAADFQPLEA